MTPKKKKKTNNPILKHNVIHVMCNDKFYMAKGKITLKMPLETQVPDGNNTILKHNVFHVMCNHKFCMAKGKITLKMPLETQVIIYN